MFLNENSQPNNDTLEYLVESDNSVTLASEATMLEIIMESQQEMHNLQMSMIRLEHTAVVSEDTALLESGVKEFFTRMIEALKKAWAKVKSWFTALFTKIKVMFSNTKTLIDKYGARIDGLNPTDLKLKVHAKYSGIDGKQFISAMTEINGQVKTVSKKTQAKEFGQDRFRAIVLKHLGVTNSKTKGIAEAMSASILGEEKEQDIKGDRIKAYKATLKVGSAVISELQSFEKLIDATFNHAISAANKGLSASEDEQELYQKQCSADQNASAVQQQVVSAYTAVYTKHFNEATRVIKAALSHDAGTAKAEPAAAEKTPEVKGKDKKADPKKSESVLENFGF